MLARQEIQRGWRTEVLRGPESTLFGRDAARDAVTITSIRPTDEFEHQLRALIAGCSDDLRARDNDDQRLPEGKKVKGLTNTSKVSISRASIARPESSSSPG